MERLTGAALEAALETMSEEEALQRMAALKLEMDALRRKLEVGLEVLEEMDPEMAAKLRKSLNVKSTTD